MSSLGTARPSAPITSTRRQAAISSTANHSRHGQDSLEKAVSVADAGDEVLVRGGVYRETLTAVRDGTSRPPFTFRGYGKESVLSPAQILVNPKNWTLDHGSITKFRSICRSMTATRFFSTAAPLVNASWPNLPYPAVGDPNLLNRKNFATAISASSTGTSGTLYPVVKKGAPPAGTKITGSRHSPSLEDPNTLCKPPTSPVARPGAVNYATSTSTAILHPYRWLAPLHQWSTCSARCTRRVVLQPRNRNAVSLDARRRFSG